MSLPSGRTTNSNVPTAMDPGLGKEKEGRQGTGGGGHSLEEVALGLALKAGYEPTGT